MSKNNIKTKAFDYKGTVYLTSCHRGVVNVKVERTARGQEIKVGTYDAKNNIWSTHKKHEIPNQVKNEIERFYIST